MENEHLNPDIPEEMPCDNSSASPPADGKRSEKKILIACSVIAGIIIILAVILVILLSGSSKKPETETAAVVTTTISTTEATTTSTTVKTTASTAITTTTTTAATTDANTDISSYEGYWYTEEDGAENELQIHSTSADGLVFTLSIYRTAGYDRISAELKGDTAYFNQNGLKGCMTFKKGYIVFDVDYADNSSVPTSPKNYTSHGKQEIPIYYNCQICGASLEYMAVMTNGYCEYCYKTYHCDSCGEIKTEGLWNGVCFDCGDFKTGSCGLCDERYVIDGSDTGYCNDCYAFSYCHTCKQIKPYSVFEGQCSDCFGEYCDSCGADITYRGGTYDTNGNYLCDDCYYGLDSDTQLVAVTCINCGYQFYENADTLHHYCSVCGQGWTYYE